MNTQKVSRYDTQGPQLPRQDATINVKTYVTTDMANKCDDKCDDQLDDKSNDKFDEILASKCDNKYNDIM